MEEKEEEKDTTAWDDKLKTQVEEKIEEVLDNGIQIGNIEYLGQLIDVHKDVANEDYWKVKKEVMCMRYGNYSEGSYSRGGYSEGGSYGRRGVPGTGRGRYRGGYSGAEDSLNRMHDSYNGYSESSNAANNGNYGAEQDSIECLETMLESVCDFMEKLEREANSPEEVQMIKKYARKIGER